MAIHYDVVEPPAILADIATIVLSSVVAGLLYHYLQDTGTVDYSANLPVRQFSSRPCSSRPENPRDVQAGRITGPGQSGQGGMPDLDNAIPSARWRHIGAEDRKWNLPRRQQPLRNVGFIALIAHRRLTEHVLAKVARSLAGAGSGECKGGETLEAGVRPVPAATDCHAVRHAQGRRFRWVCCSGESWYRSCWLDIPGPHTREVRRPDLHQVPGSAWRQSCHPQIRSIWPKARRHGARLPGEHAIDRRVGTILLERITSGLSRADATCLRKPARFGA
jgi:hypothetical protein